MDDGASLVALFDRDASPVRYQNLLHEGETDAVTTRLCREEWNEHALQVLSANAGPGIADAYVCVPRSGSRVDAPCYFHQLISCVDIDRLRGVSQQIRECPAQHRFVSRQIRKNTPYGQFDS